MAVIVMLHISNFIQSKPITVENSVHQISPKVFIIHNVTSNFKNIFGKNITTGNNNNSNINSYTFNSNPQDMLDLPCPYKTEITMLSGDTYEVISKDSGSWVLKRAPNVINITCLKPKKDCCTKTCKTGTKRKSFVRMDKNKQLIKGSYEERTIGEYCKCML